MSTSCVISAHIPKVERCPNKRKCTVVKKVKKISPPEESENLMQIKAMTSETTIAFPDTTEKKLPLPVNSQVIYIFLRRRHFQNIYDVRRAHIYH